LGLTRDQRDFLLESATIAEIKVTPEALGNIESRRITSEQKSALQALEGLSFVHPWLLGDALAQISPEWRPLIGEDTRNQKIGNLLAYLYNLLQDPLTP